MVRHMITNHVSLPGITTQNYRLWADSSQKKWVNGIKMSILMRFSVQTSNVRISPPSLLSAEDSPSYKMHDCANVTMAILRNLQVTK